MSEERCAGALIAGGASRRMGMRKGDVRLGETTLAQRAAATLRRLTPLVVQCGGEPYEDLAVDVIIPDCRKNGGPAAGIEAALRRFDIPVVVLAVDVPFVPAALLEEALRVVEAGAEACAPHWRGRWHALSGAYSAGALRVIRRRLDRGDLDLQGLLQEIGTPLQKTALKSLGDPDRVLFNVNTPEDLEEAERLRVR